MTPDYDVMPGYYELVPVEPPPDYECFYTWRAIRAITIRGCGLDYDVDPQ